MGVVHEARDLERGGSVALKTLSRVDGDSVYTLKQEFRALSGILHTNLVVLHELFCDHGLWYFTMELVLGSRFDAWLNAPESGPDDVRLRAAFLQLAQAMQALHAAGRVHCDLKPGNVLVTPEGRVVVLDFGLVTQYQNVADTLSMRFGAAGTPAYMAPERGALHRVTPACDAYAFGVMLFHALTGRLPFFGHESDVIQRKQAEAAPDPRTYNPRANETLARLCTRLLARAPEARPSDAEIIAAFGAAQPSAAERPSLHLPNVRPLFVGRKQELSLLQDAVDSARAGRAESVLFAGPSGVGKSALLEHFAASAPAEVCVLRGRCHPEESVPYNVLDGLMDDLMRSLKHGVLARRMAVPRHMRSLAQLFPVLEPLSRAAPTPRHSLEEPRERRRQAFDALKELLLRLTDLTVLVMIVDDLQWGDTDSMRLLSHLLGPPEAPPLLFVGAYRNSDVQTSEFLRLAVADDAGDYAFRPRVHELGALEVGAAIELVQTVVVDTQIPNASAVARALAEEAQRLPFFIIELAEQLNRRADRAAAEVEPISVERALRERVRDLPREVLRLLQVISLAGRPLPQLEALELAELPSNNPLPLLALRAARLAQMHPRDLIEVYHDRIREVVIADMTPEARRSLHAHIADALQRQPRHDPERLLVHWLGADERGAAGRTAVAAAQSAVQKLAFNRAAELFCMAIELLPSDQVIQSELYRQLADALADAGRGASAADAYLKAAEGATPHARTALECSAVRQYLRSGRIQSGVALLRRLMAAHALRWPSSTIDAFTMIAWNMARLRLRGVRYALVPEASVPPEQLARLDVLGSAFRELGVLDVMHGVALQTTYLREALAAGEPQRLLVGLAWEAFNSALLADASDRTRALRLLEHVETLAAAIDTPYAAATGKMARAAASYFFARFEDARDLADGAQTLFREKCLGTSWEQQVLIRLGAIEWTGGLQHILREAPDQAREAKERDDHFCQGFLALSLAAAQLMEDAPQAALALLEEQRQLLSDEFGTAHVWVMHRTIDSYNYLGLGVEALHYHREHWAAFTGSYLYRTKPFYVLAHWFRVKSAIGAAVAELTPERLAIAARAAKNLERTGRTEAHCLSLLAMAAIAHLQTDRERAQKYLLSAIDGCTKHQCGLLAVYARRNLGVVLGNAEGERLIAEADADLRAQGVRNPARWVATYAPGFVATESPAAAPVSSFSTFPRAST
jgi:eukaryotic-like serine/threonine-protein kinase